jgi:hypothetical protein
MVSWQEADKTTVVHVEDFKNGIVHTNVTGPNGIFLRRSGTWKRVHSPSPASALFFPFHVIEAPYHILCNGTYLLMG